MSRDSSEIVAIDPVTYERRVLLDGRRNGFYSRIRGKQQMLDNGSLVVTSPQQGRAFEIDAVGKTALEIANLKPGSDTDNYVLPSSAGFRRTISTSALGPALPLSDCPMAHHQQ